MENEGLRHYLHLLFFVKLIQVQYFQPGGGRPAKGPAHLKFTGNMKKTFDLLTSEMDKKGAANLLKVGKFKQTYHQGASDLKRATDLKAKEYNAKEAEKIYDKLDQLTKDKTPPELAPAMIDMMEMCTNYLAQNAEYNKDKGPAFKMLVSEMNKQPTVKLIEKDKIQKTNAQAAKELESARGFETDHDEPGLTEKILGTMNKLVARVTPTEMKQDMDETVDACSKYLSQKAIDDLERGPAFDLLIKEMEKQGEKPFADFPTIKTRAAAAYVLKSAPGLGSSKADPKTVEEMKKALHKTVDAATPTEMTEDMTNVINLCSNYLSAFVRDRTLAMQGLLTMMKNKPSGLFAQRNDYKMDYAIAADELENAPQLIPYLPVKDIADEGKANLTRDMKNVTPPELKVAMTSLIKDASKHLSQLVAIRSGVVGDRYKMDFLSEVTKSLGAKPLYKYKTFVKTYGDASNELNNADSSGDSVKNLDTPTLNLGHEIHSELKRGIPTKLAPTVVQDTAPTMDIASKHLAKVGVEKGDAMDYVVTLMKDKGDENLAKLQGYEQTYADGARRIENSPTLYNSTVDMPAFAAVKDKLVGMTEEKPEDTQKYTQVLPEIIDDTANFLAKPEPKTNAEKRQVLADLMGRKGSEIIGKKDAYKLTYQQGGKDLRNAPVGVTQAHDEEKKEVMHKQIAAVIPDKKLKKVLEEPAKEGAAYLTDTIEGRAQALGVLESDLKKEGPKKFIDVGAYKKDHTEVADMLVTAPYLRNSKPSPVILENVEHRLEVLPKETPIDDKPMAKQHMQSMTDIAARYIATEATKQCGLDGGQLAALDAEGFNADAKALAEQRRLAAITAGPGAGIMIAETREARMARLAAEAEKKRLEEEEKKRLAEEMAEKLRKAREKYRGGALGADYDLEHLAALDILHQELKAHGPELFYEQPQTVLTHGKASDWLLEPEPMKVDKSVKNSGDVARLHKKFEKKLNTLVQNKTPPHLNDPMQDVVIEAARKTAEFFAVSNFKSLVKDNLVSAMQERGNEILVEVDGAAETHFFAAQRMKRKDPDAVPEPCYKVVNDIEKKLEDVVRSRPMPKKLSSTMRDHIKETSKYLSSEVTKPDDYIEAYVTLLSEMEAAGDAPLIEGDVPKTAKESANYLRTLTTFKDVIGRPNKPMQNAIETKLKNMMLHAPPSRSPGSAAAMKAVIADAASLLVSYVMFQAAKADAMDLLVKEMKKAGDGALLRHGPVRKSFKDGAALLDGKTSDDLVVNNADPVVARKIQIKLNNLMFGATPAKFEALMIEVITEATMFLAEHILDPKVFKVCKCYNNVFVQCELWCDEILRRVAKPCCTCSRHVSVQALADLAPTDFLAPAADNSHVLAPGVEISFKSCPNQARNLPPGEPLPLCPGVPPQTTSYLLYEMTHKIYSSKDIAVQQQPSPSLSPSTSGSDSYTPKSPLSSESPLTRTKQPSSPKPHLLDIHADNPKFVRKQLEQMQYTCTLEESPSFSSSATSYDFEASSSHSKPSRDRSQQFSSKLSQAKSGYSSRTPIISAEHMVDWDATMVSLLWNVLAWRDWIQEIVDHALSYQFPSFARGETSVSSWLTFYRRVTSEAVQWRQYSVFSRQLTNRLHLRYRDKEIESPRRSTVQTETYIKCQEAMLDIIEMFNRWTQWLTLVVKETDSLQQALGSEVPLYQMRWNHLKMKVEGYSRDWVNYNKFLKVSWEQKYSAIIADYLPSWKKPGPVWVVSDCGAVPSGAVAAGVCDGEVIWVARAMHRCTVLPATLLPSKHCCLVYAEGQVHSYNKYQVMCNAEVRWLAWRGGSIAERAVSVAPGMYVGRVHYHGDHLLGAVYEPDYHCHVVIFGRPFAFNCYELLILVDVEDQEHDQ